MRSAWFILNFAGWVFAVLLIVQKIAEHSACSDHVGIRRAREDQYAQSLASCRLVRRYIDSAVKDMHKQYAQTSLSCAPRRLALYYLCAIALFV